MKVKFLGTYSQGGGTVTTVPDANGVGARYVRVSNAGGGLALIEVRATAGGSAVTSSYLAPYENMIIKKDADQFLYGNTSNLYFVAVAPHP
tara:strand:+ start:2732 stop:3004 length:273 start_codon:yes stop_codon:yes gene_type:complete